MTTAAARTGFLHLVVGYDGSPPAVRALDAAANLLQGRDGRIEVVYVAHLSSLAMLSASAVAAMESDFDEIEQELRGAAAVSAARPPPPTGSSVRSPWAWPVIRRWRSSSCRNVGSGPFCPH